MRATPLLAAGLLLLIACAPPDEAALPAPTPAEAFAELETRLLAARTIEMRYRARSTGAYQIDLAGELRVETGTIVRLEATGTFGGDSIKLELAAAGGTMHGGNGATSFDGPTPPGLIPAILLGLTRMGILHNLALLSAAQPPDHAEGGVGDWVRPLDVTRSGDPPPAPAAATGFDFAVEVAGQRTAEAVLWLDDRELPTFRTQEVAFPGGSMRVEEEYEFVRFDL